MNKYLSTIVLSAMFALWNVQAIAALYTIDFSSAGSNQHIGDASTGTALVVSPGASFATLTFNDVTKEFSISAANFNSTFGSTGFSIQGLSIDTTQITSDMEAVQIGGTSNVNSATKFTSLLPFNFDIRYAFDGGVNHGVLNSQTLIFNIPVFNKACLAASTTTCTQSLNVIQPEKFALFVSNGVIGSGNVSSWISGAVPTPAAAVPEVSSNIMMLFGLTLLGLILHHRRTV